MTTRTKFNSPTGNVYIRQESSITNDIKNVFQFIGLPVDLSYSPMKYVVICYQNKTYCGVGLRNDNGGLEFFCEEIKKSQDNKIFEKLSLFRKQKEELTTECKRLTTDVTSDLNKISKWKRSRAKLNRQLKVLQRQMDNLLIHARQEDVLSSDSLKMRQQLRLDMKKINSSLTELNEKIVLFTKKNERLVFLQQLIPQLTAKISDLESNVSYLNTLTVGSHDVLYFPFQKGVKSNSCCLFADVFDYYSYKYLCNRREFANLPHNNDCLVLNDPCNIVSFLINSDDYDKIYLFFPKTFYGYTLEQTFLQRHPGRAVSVNDCYGNYVCLVDCLKGFFADNH